MILNYKNHKEMFKLFDTKTDILCNNDGKAILKGYWKSTMHDDLHWLLKMTFQSICKHCSRPN